MNESFHFILLMKKDQVIFYLSIIKQNLHALALALTSLNPTTSAGKVLPERTIVQPKEISRGFVPVIPRLLHHYTDGWYKGYQWQIGHPIRQRVLDKFPCNRFFAYLIARLSGSICTVSAYNIFSIFVEHSKKSQDHDFIKLICTRHEKKGLKEFEELINSIPDSTGKKGMAFLCSVGPRSMRIHEFVIELTPARELYIYQSYQGQYSLQKSLKEQKALDPTKVLDALKILISPELLDLTEISEEEPTPERVEAYQFLFHATDNFQKLYLSFTPLEYDIGSIPSAPVSLAFAQRIWNIWLRCVANIQDMLSNLATRIQRL